MEETLSLLSSIEQEELAILRRELEGKDGEMRNADPTERGGKENHSQPPLKMSRFNLCFTSSEHEICD